MKGRESGDVRLILDTKGERVSEQKKKKENTAKGSAHGRTESPQSELQNIGAEDTERTEARVKMLPNTHAQL